MNRPNGMVGSISSRGRGVAALAVVAAAMLVAVVATAGLFGLRAGQSDIRGSGSLAGGTPPAPALAAGTGVVARLAVEQWASSSWAPDGAHLLIRQQSGSFVYDRLGQRVGSFGPGEGWLDAGHLIDGDAHVWALTDEFQPKSGQYPWYGPVVAGGHGSAAVIVAMPACTGDPYVNWYRDGGYTRSNEKVTVFGWSPDGRYVLKGHLDCSDQEAMLHGWKGHVDVVDFASGRVAATVPGVRGQMAFNPSGTRLAAQSDADMAVVGVGAGEAATFLGVRFLSWLDDDHVFALGASGVEVVGVSGGPSTTPVAAAEWQIPSVAGPRLVADTHGAVKRVVAADGTTVLLDLASYGLETERDWTAGGQTQSALQKQWWSPDGGMLALESADGTSLVLISIDPNKPGVVGTALPTPVASAGVLSEAGGTPLPGAVSQLVADYQRNALWFVGGAPGAPEDLYRYDITTGKVSNRSLGATASFDPSEARLAISPTGSVWVGSGLGIVVYDPGTDKQVSVVPPNPGADAQTDPANGKPNPRVSRIAFDASGNAVIARNWVRSLTVIDPSGRNPTTSVDVSDGFPMTGDLAVVGSRAFIVVDPASGLMISVDLAGHGPASKGVPGGGADTKASASMLVAVGDCVLTAGTPPGWLAADGSGTAMVEPVLNSVDLVTAGPGGSAVLYSSELGEAQWRDKDGHVSAQAAFPAGKGPKITAIALDSQNRLWAVEPVGSGAQLVRLDPAG